MTKLWLSPIRTICIGIVNQGVLRYLLPSDADFRADQKMVGV